MKNSLKFLTLSLFILLVQNSLAYKYEAGNESKARSQESIAIGLYNEAGDSTKPNESFYSSAIGSWNTASGKNSSAFGYWNEASGGGSSAFGNQVFVSGEGSGAFGKGYYNGSNHVYKIEGNDSWAIGSYNSIAAGANNNHILGNNIAIATGITGSIVLGDKSTVEDSNTLSVGSATNRRRIVHVADGIASTDAVNVGQLNTRAKNDASNLSVSDVTAWKTKLGVASIDAYTKAESDAKFLDKATYNTDKANFATKTEVNTKVNKDGSNLSASDVATWKTKLGVGTGGGSIDAYTKAETDTKLGTKADKTDVYSKAETNSKLNSKANLTDVYTKADSDNKFLDKSAYNTDKANFATKTELNDKANKADVYTKVETDNKFNTMEILLQEIIQQLLDIRIM